MSEVTSYPIDFGDQYLLALWLEIIKSRIILMATRPEQSECSSAIDQEDRKQINEQETILLLLLVVVV